MLFEVAILERPTLKEEQEGATEQLVFGPKLIIARDTWTAGLKALAGDDRPKCDMDRAIVMVRPFVERTESRDKLKQDKAATYGSNTGLAYLGGSSSGYPRQPPTSEVTSGQAGYSAMIGYAGNINAAESISSQAAYSAADLLSQGR